MKALKHYTDSGALVTLKARISGLLKVVKSKVHGQGRKRPQGGKLGINVCNQNPGDDTDSSKSCINLDSPFLRNRCGDLKPILQRICLKRSKGIRFALLSRGMTPDKGLFSSLGKLLLWSVGLSFVLGTGQVQCPGIGRVPAGMSIGVTLSTSFSGRDGLRLHIRLSTGS